MSLLLIHGGIPTDFIKTLAVNTLFIAKPPSEGYRQENLTVPIPHWLSSGQKDGSCVPFRMAARG